MISIANAIIKSKTEASQTKNNNNRKCNLIERREVEHEILRKSTKINYKTVIGKSARQVDRA